MNTNEAVASEVAAPAASEAAAPAAGQESVGVGPAGPDGIPVADRPLQEYRFLHATKLEGAALVKNPPSSPVVAASCLGSPAVARSHTKNPVESRRGYMPSRGTPQRPGPVQK